jgi:hypothetical protein
LGGVASSIDCTKSGKSTDNGLTALTDSFQGTHALHGASDMQHILRVSLWSSLPIVVFDGLIRLLDLFENERSPAVDDDKVEFLLLGGPLAVLRALRRHADSVEIQVAGCQVLSSMLHNQRASLFWITYLGCGLGAVTVVLATLKDWFDSVTVQEAGFQLLIRLVSFSPSNAKLFCEAGGIEVITRRVARYPKSSRTKSDVCWLLEKLCAWEEARVALLEVEAVVFLYMPNLGGASESTSSSKTSVTSLSSFASSGASDDILIFDDSSEPSVCSVHSLSEVLMMAPGPAIRKASKSRAYRKGFAVDLPTPREIAQAAEQVQIFCEPAIRTLLKAVSTDLWNEADKTVEGTLEQVLALLLKLSNPTLSTLLVGIGPLALVKVVERATRHDSTTSTSIHHKALLLIQTLASRLEGFRALFHDLDAIEGLVTSLQQASLRSNPKLVRMGLLALRELLKRSGEDRNLVDRLAGAGGIDLLVQVMVEHSLNQSVQLHACKLLHLCANIKTLRGRMVKAGAMGALLAVIENHSDSAKALAAAKRVIQDFVQQ